ncbi:MAG: LPS assembly lipoprotein LptE [Bacteroidetes bacterium]|nr:LPS assembly lipoprotein LptE [Bacteroidota bacterium]
MKISLTYLSLLFLVFAAGCKMSVSFTGGKIEGKTFNIGDFPNYAPIVQPSFSQAFVDALRNKIVNESNLKYSQDTPDLLFTGSIKDYKITPISATSNTTAAGNRLTVSIEVTYESKIDPKKNFTKSYTEFADFSIDQNLTDIENDLISEIVKKLAQQVYLDIIPAW